MNDSESAPGAVTGFAPATVANVSVGFDVLGFALQGVGDRVTVAPAAEDGVVVESITGVVTDLPTEPERNTASVALLALLRDLEPGHGFRISIEKGIPLGSGMGGSAASAVGAVVAANQLLPSPVPRAKLLRYAMAGEEAASGVAHADNAAPCLFGGMTAVIAHDPPEVVRIPVPADLLCVVVHPHLRIDTRDAREALRPEIALADHVRQSMRLTGFLAGCFQNDPGLIARSMADDIVEPQRARKIPGFDEARAAAKSEGALGFGISGSGPSVFAWTMSATAARAVEAAVARVFEQHGLQSDRWVSPIHDTGAEIES